MPHSLVHRVIALLWIAAFGLGQTVIAPFGVRCEHPSGQTRLELACVKTDDGSCRTECASKGEASPESSGSLEAEDESEHAPHPCKDTPIGDPAGAAKLLTRVGSANPAQIVSVFVLAVQQIERVNPIPARPLAPAWANARPPDAAARLRTVILVV